MFEEGYGRVGTARTGGGLKMLLGIQTKSNVWSISVYCLWEAQGNKREQPANSSESEGQNWALLPIGSLLHVAHKSSDTSRSGLLHSRKLEWENEAWSSEPDYQVEKGETSHSLLQNLPTLQVSSQASTRSTGKSAGRIFFHFHLVE